LTDLWSDQGDVLIYLFPKSAGKGASIKLDSSLFDASAPIQHLLFAAGGPHVLDPTAVSEQQQFNVQSPGGSSIYSTKQGFPPTDQLSRLAINPNGPAALGVERHVYVPLTFDDIGLSHHGGHARGDDLELLVLYRNFFAFLLGAALISTPRQVSLFSIFLGISSILTRFEFTNIDGSTYGDVAAHSFARYQDELRLADVRSSREKTIEAIVLGEKMKSWTLYNEGFAHAVGKLEDMKKIDSPKYNMISQETQTRMERALHDLQKRVMTIKLKIDDFDFPSMFSGIANSVTEKESKLVRFKAWKASFMAFRKHTIDHYKHRYGAWPPKANSKKHNFEGSGLNRVLLLEMYRDFTDLYDMLADRANLTSRTADLYSLGEDAETNDLNESLQHAMRRVESEYDRSGVPVLPPIPFDVPLVPSFSGSFNRQHTMISSNSATSSKKLKDNEVNEVLLGSYNRPSMKATPWLQDFLSYERRTGHSKTMDEIVDMRCGQWLFMYAILQSLPNLVVDARELKYTDNVEYFLCVAPRGGRPWMKDDTSQSRSWYNVANGGGLVSLPSDVIDHSVEGIYRRSHCWVVATQWAADIGAISPTGPPHEFLPPPPFTEGNSPRLSSSPRVSPHLTPGSRSGSPAISDSGRLSRTGDQNSVHLGLQAVPPPEGQRSRPVSTYNPNTTFDTILGTTEGHSPGKKKGRK
jgi:hypothetical protein